MVRRALLPAALLLSLGEASAAPSHWGAPLAPTVTARAGVDGVGRPGRWLPVDVAVTGGDSGAEGTVRVEWGDAVVIRDIDVAPGANAQLTVLVRAIAAAQSVRLTLTTTRAAALSIDAPITLRPIDAPLTLCVGMDAPRCTVRISEDEAPTTWRGFDLADEVLWPGLQATTRRDAAVAFSTWQAARWRGDSGLLDPVLPPFDTASPIVASLTKQLLGFVVIMTLVVGAAAWRRGHPALLVGFPVIAGLVAAAVTAHADSGAALQTTAVIHQFQGVSQSTVSLRGEVQHAGGGMVELQPDLRDATLNASVTGSPRSLSVESRDGRALYRAAAGLGATRRFSLEGTLDAEWIEIQSAGGLLTIRNRAPFPLAGCEWRGAEPHGIGTIAAGALIRLDAAGSPASGDAVVCVLPVDWLNWSGSASPITTRGHSLLVFHFWPGSAQGASSAAR